MEDVEANLLRYKNILQRNQEFKDWMCSRTKTDRDPNWYQTMYICELLRRWYCISYLKGHYPLSSIKPVLAFIDHKH